MVGTTPALVKVEWNIKNAVGEIETIKETIVEGEFIWGQDIKQVTLDEALFYKKSDFLKTFTH